MAEKISIITISYNSETTIEKTIKSVLKQSYRPLEYVFVDGGSKDGTIEIIESYLPQLNNCGIETSFKSEPDKGISDAFNKGIERSTGDIIGIINSDDQLAENVIQKVADKIGKCDVICGDCLWIDEENELKYIRKSKMELDKLKYEMVLMHPTCFVRKSAYITWGGFDVSFKYVMDKELMARFYRNGAKFEYIPEVLAIMYAGGASDANTKKVFEEGIRVAECNGVPKIFALIRARIKGFQTKAIQKIKKNKKLWKLIKR